MELGVVDRALRTVFEGNLIEFQEIVKEFPTIVKFFKDGETFLHLAVDDGQEAITEYLLNAGSDPNTKNEGGETPLHLAIFRGYSTLVTLLLSHKADPFIQNTEGKSSFQYAQEYSSPQIRSQLQHYFDKDLNTDDWNYSESSDFSDETLTLTKKLSDTDLQIIFTEPSIIEESTHYSALNLNLKGTLIEHLDTKNNFSNEDIFDFLHETGLRKYFKSLFRAGFDSFEWMFIQMRTPVRIDHEILSEAGVDCKQDREKLIREIESRSAGFEYNKDFDGLLGLLYETDLHEYYNSFMKHAIVDLQALALFANESPVEFDAFLQDSIKMHKIGHRIRITGVLRGIEVPKKRLCSLL